MKVSASLEDYLEAIYEICQSQSVARVKDISHRLGVTNASVVGALRQLREKGLIEQERYGYVKLTQKGKALAKDVCGRHKALSGFFQEVLGLGKKTAEEDACKAEHSLSWETIERLILLQNFLKKKPQKCEDLLGEFQEYIKEKTKVQK